MSTQTERTGASESLSPALWLRFAQRIVQSLRHHIPNNVPVDDAVSEALLAMVQSAHSFDPSRGIAFTTYVYPRIRGRVLNLARKETFHAHVNHDCLPAVQASTEQIVARREQHRCLLTAIQTLPTTRRRVLSQLLAGRSTKEAAAVLDLSAQRVRSNRRKAVRQLHEALCPAG